LFPCPNSVHIFPTYIDLAADIAQADGVIGGAPVGRINERRALCCNGFTGAPVLNPVRASAMAHRLVAVRRQVIQTMSAPCRARPTALRVRSWWVPGSVVAAAFAAVLYKIVTGDSVIAGLTNLINTALSTTF